MAHKDIIETTDPNINAMDNPSHEQTYAGFIAFVKWSILILAVLVVLLFIWIRP